MYTAGRSGFFGLIAPNCAVYQSGGAVVVDTTAKCTVVFPLSPCWIESCCSRSASCRRCRSLPRVQARHWPRIKGIRAGHHSGIALQEDVVQCDVACRPDSTTLSIIGTPQGAAVADGEILHRYHAAEDCKDPFRLRNGSARPQAWRHAFASMIVCRPSPRIVMFFLIWMLCSVYTPLVTWIRLPRPAALIASCRLSDAAGTQPLPSAVQIKNTFRLCRLRGDAQEKQARGQDSNKHLSHTHSFFLQAAYNNVKRDGR